MENEAEVATKAYSCDTNIKHALGSVGFFDVLLGALSRDVGSPLWVVHYFWGHYDVVDYLEREGHHEECRTFEI